MWTPLVCYHAPRVPVNSCFETGQQATDLLILLAARFMVLDRGRQIGGLFWSTHLPPRKVYLFPLRLLSKSQACRPLREMGGGVNDLHCCVTHSWGVLKARNSWSQQSVHHFICGLQYEQRDSRWDPGDASVSSVSVAVFIVRLLLLRQTRNRRCFQIKSPPLRTQF